jgi:hypothetical protein
MIFAAVWWDHGIAAIAEQTALFFPAYKKAGGQLNELVADWEATMFQPGACSLPDNGTAAGLKAVKACLACVLDKWRAIGADPRFPAALTTLQALGFKLNGTLAETMGRYQCVATNDTALRPGGMTGCAELDGLGEWQANLLAWNALKEQRQTDAWVEAVVPSARKSFPSVRLSLYGHYSWGGKHCAVPDVGSGRMVCASGVGSSPRLNVSAPVYYDEWLTFDCLHPHGLPGGVDAANRCAGTTGLSNTLQKLSKHPKKFSFNFTGYNIVKATVNNFRQIALSVSGTTTELAPWVGFKSFMFDYRCPDSTENGGPAEWPAGPSSSPGCPEPDGYWQERVLHYGITGAVRFYYFVSALVSLAHSLDR